MAGLPFLILDAQLDSRRSTALTVAGTADLEERLRATMDLLFPGSQRALELVEATFVVIEPGTATELGPASVQPFEVQHSCGSPPFAVRLTSPSGTIVSYSGDTEWTDTLLDAADGADLFIAEAYFHEKRIRWHLDYTTLVGYLPQLQARRVVATHLSADMLEHSGDDLAIPLAYDGLTIDL